jgi:hypothetical protein
MKLIGITSPSSGLFQRTSASAPTSAAALRVDLRLQVDAQFAVVERAAQQVFHADANLGIAVISGV